MKKPLFLRRRLVLPVSILTGVLLIGIGGAVAASYSRRPFGIHWCGNGRVEYRETCDDGNRRSGDGCSRRCQRERNANTCGGRMLGESFIGPDGCNTCVCTQGGMACTKMYCQPRSSSSSRSSQRSSISQSSSSRAASSSPSMTKCFSSNQCGSGMYCTTEDGDCQSACAPGAENCMQVCAGICRAR